MITLELRVKGNARGRNGRPVTLSPLGGTKKEDKTQHAAPHSLGGLSTEKATAIPATMTSTTITTTRTLMPKKEKYRYTRLMHLNSTRTARPFGGPGSSSRVQMLRFGAVFDHFGAVFDRKRRRNDRKRRRNDRKRRRFRSFRRDPRKFRRPDLNYRFGCFITKIRKLCS